MIHNPSESGEGTAGATRVAAAAAPPRSVFFVVESTGHPGERDHRLRSDAFETRAEAETELARLRRSDSGGVYCVWKSTTHVAPAEWLHRVVRLDGTLILPRLHGVEKYPPPRPV